MDIAKEDKLSESKRIEEVYRERYTKDKETYSLFNPGEHFMDIAFERELIHSLKRAGFRDLRGMKILEVGCGDGRRLRNLQRLGAIPTYQYGIELLDFYVKDAKYLSSNCKICQGDASSLPYEDSSFDIVYQRTVFTSILDNEMRKQIAFELLRVLKPRGIILWYDFHMNNPKNSDVRGIKRKELYELFPNCEIDLKKVTLAPPLAKAIAPYSLLACYLLEKLSFLRTHYLGIIKDNNKVKGYQRGMAKW